MTHNLSRITLTNDSFTLPKEQVVCLSTYHLCTKKLTCKKIISPNMLIISDLCVG